MREYIISAIVLDREPLREEDELFSFFSRDMGYIRAKAISSRKLRSKFSSHLDPMSLVTIRLVGEHGFTIADALVTDRFSKIRKSPYQKKLMFRIMAFLKEFFPEGGADNAVWDFLEKNLGEGKIDIRGFLSLLGFDAMHAACASCKNEVVVAFFIDNHSFLCKKCVSKINDSRLLYIDSHVS